MLRIIKKIIKFIKKIIMGKKCSIPDCGSTSMPQVAGVGIESIADNADGTMTITLTSGTTYDINLPEGAAGTIVTIVSCASSIDGSIVTLIFTDSEGNTFNVSYTLPEYLVKELDEEGNCVGITEGMTYDEALNALISFLCPVDDGKEIYGGVITGDVLVDDSILGTRRTPFSPFAYTDLSYDSAIGLEVNFPANTYWVDSLMLSKDAERLTLTNNSDNYLRINRNDNYAYSILASETTPSNDEDYIYLAKITVAGGVIGTLSQIISSRPIAGNMIELGSITIDHLDSEVFESVNELSRYAIRIGAEGDVASELSMLSSSDYKFLVGKSSEVIGAEINNNGGSVNVYIDDETDILTLNLNNDSVKVEHLLGLDTTTIPDDCMLWINRSGDDWNFTYIELVEGGVLTIVDGVPTFVVP